MPTLTLREGLGRPLTYQEMDDNLRFVEDRAQEAANSAGSAGLAAQVVDADRQHVDQQRQAVDDAAQSAAESASTAQHWAEQAQNIVTDGVIDDSGPSGLTTYSSEHIETKLEGKADKSSLGTAATRNVGEATGNVMEVGAFGLGRSERGNIFDPQNATDWQNLPQGFRGFLRSSAVGKPIGVVHGYITVIARRDNGDQSGLYVQEYNGLRAWVGEQIDGQLPTWTEVLSTGNIGSQRLDLMTASYASSGAIDGINSFSNAVVRITANTNRTLSLTNPPANNRAQVLTVLLTGSNGTITWPSVIRWSGGAAPDLMASWTAVTLMWAGDGYWYGFVSGGAD